jgi:hypothetical protein
VSGNLAGGSALVALIILLMFGTWIAGVIDLISRPGWAFRAAGRSKALWLLLQVIFGFIASLVYFGFIRRSVRYAQASSGTYAVGPRGFPPPGYPPTAPPAPTSTGGGGWHPDPSGRHQYRYWDGRTWTDAVSDYGDMGTDPPQ